MCIRLYVKHPLFLKDFNDNWFLQQILEKLSDEPLQSPSSRNRVVQCGQTDRLTSRYDEANSGVLEFYECAWSDGVVMLVSYQQKLY